MGALKVGDLRPGMVLGKPALDGKGHPILRDGVALTEKHIQLLSSWKVETVDVLGANDVPIAELETAAANDARTRADLDAIEARFQGITDEVLLQLRDIVKRRLLSRVARP